MKTTSKWLAVALTFGFAWIGACSGDPAGGDNDDDVAVRDTGRPDRDTGDDVDDDTTPDTAADPSVDVIGDDRDGDGVPDRLDPCPDDRPDDTDSDGVCDSDDICPGSDDAADTDGDGRPNGCDTCPLDAADDSDGDGACDSDDICPAGSDFVDQDSDGIPNACDSCPTDNPDDSDNDGVCDSDDICPGFDDNQDADDNGTPDGCDDCTGGDEDSDGVCDALDACPGFDDRVNTDGDLLPDGCDDCPNDAADDSDSDGVCDSDDICMGFDDTADIDTDGVPDGCDPCPDTIGGDADGDGVCDADDICANGDDTVDDNANGVPDACEGDPGFYTYQRLPIGGIEQGSAVDIHPDNAFFVFTESSGAVHIYDIATQMTESVSLNPGGTPYWTDVRFSPDGSYAILTGGIDQSNGGIVYRFDTASYLDTLTPTADAFVRLDAWTNATAAYTTVQFHPDTGVPWLLAYWGTGGDIFTLLTLDPIADTVELITSENAGDPCHDMAFVNNEFGSPGVLVSCSVGSGLRYYTEVGGTWEMRRGFQTTATNMGRVAAPPNQSHALILANFIGAAYEFSDGVMSDDSFRSNTSSFIGIEFSPDGQRALILGGYESISGTVVGRVFEYRSGFFDCAVPGTPDCGWNDVSITNYGQPPFNSERGWYMSDLGWRTDCDGGVIVGGYSNFAGSTGQVITFERIGGVDCWD